MPIGLETIVALMFASAFDYFVFTKLISPARYGMITLIFGNVLYALLGVALYNPPPYLITVIINAHVLMFCIVITLEAIYRVFDVSSWLLRRKQRALIRKYTY